MSPCPGVFRLVAPAGVPLVAAQLMRLRLSAVWVCMAAFDQATAVPDNMEGEPASVYVSEVTMR